MTSPPDSAALPPNGSDPEKPAEVSAETGEGGDPVLTYYDAPDSLIELWMARRKRMALEDGERLPPPDMPLQPLLEARIPANEPAPEAKLSLHRQKLRAIRAELAGKSELAGLNCILIPHLRKREWPRNAPILFRRIWTEAGPQMTRELPTRWLISSLITFGDHGETEAQRRIGLAMNVLFSTMKLYEFERFHSGTWPGTAFPMRRVGRMRLPLGMPNFSLLTGGLDVNLLAQLWHEARAEPVAGALACYLLEQLNADPRNLFRRIGLMRAARQAEEDSLASPPEPGEDRASDPVPEAPAADQVSGD